jgi:hypothetical protein
MQSKKLSFQDIEISLDGLSAAPGEGSAKECRLIHRVENISRELRDSLAVEELYRGDNRLAIIGTRALAEVTSPGGIVFYHKRLFILGEFALSLRYRA